ncbi:AKAP7 2'5' RNA ligase-like domain-containing protein [Phaeosphaeria sp. MPI-PUGE-AT-0046c]|nr:AKAP7 2'5' RNA ligase-like domain-containing protein [Phaeosphaeria sp. MPI-PUGE-AT-0046c]
MGKKKQTGEYNDFLDGEKLRDNGEIRTSLQRPATAQDVSPPPVHQGRGGNKRQGKGKGVPRKPPLTHFLCLPLVTDTSREQLQRSLETLKRDLQEKAVVPPKAVRPLGTLHLTLGVMSLDETKMEEAKQYLQNLGLHRLLRDLTQRGVAEKAAEDGTISENLNAAALPDTDGLTIGLEALTPMQSPQNTSILYATPVDPTHRLYSFASALRKDFTEKGFMIEDTRPLKLHATIINTIYAKPGGGRGRKNTVKETLKHIEHKVSPHHHSHSPHTNNTSHSITDSDHKAVDKASSDDEEQVEQNQGHGPDAKSWLRFDARELIEKYKDFKWAEEVRIDRVQICKMGARKVWSGGREGEGEVLDERYEVVEEKGIFE